MPKPGVLTTLTTPKIKRAEVGGRDDQLHAAAITGVYVDEAATIAVQHTIDTGIVEPPFVLGALNQGEKVIGLNADTVDGYDVGVADGLATLGADGLVPTSQLPALGATPTDPNTALAVSFFAF